MAPKAYPLSQLQQPLRQRLQTASSIAVLGVGSELRGDDAVGMRVAALLSGPECEHPRLRVHFGSTAPESATGPIRVQQPSHLIIVDAAALGAVPGQVALLEAEEISGVTFCTHALPLSVVIDFIRDSNRTLDVFLLAIQAEHMEFGEPLSERLERAAQDLSELLLDTVRSLPEPTSP